MDQDGKADPYVEVNVQCEGQCDQIGQFMGLWATFKSPWWQLICPNLPHS